MIKNVFVTALLMGALVAQAQELPQPSPAASVSQRIGLTDINVEYSRPGVKDRVIFGDLVPFDQIWRTGANKNTTIEFSGPVVVGGKKVAAGIYSLFTIPGASEWTVILNTKNDHWGAGGYAEESDVARFAVSANKCDQVESFTIGFSDIKTGSGKLEISWDKTMVSFAINADPTAQAKKNINEAIAKEDANMRTFNSAARYYVDNNLDSKQALKWSSKSISLEKKFWNVYTHSLCQAANGQYKEALKTAMESKQMAEDADYEPYIKLNDKNITKWKEMM